MKKTKGIIIGFAGTMMISWIGNYFYDSTKNIPILKYLTISLKWLYDCIISILVFPIKTWWLLIGCFGAYILYKILANKEADNNDPTFLAYKQDVFKSWIWRWDWQLTSKGWAITNLIPYCPFDDVQLVNNSDFLTARTYCPKCGRKFGEHELPLESDVDTKILINDKINKGNYRIHP